MFIDEKTERVLGMDAIWAMIDAKSPFGKELVLNKQYFTDKKELEKRYKELGSMIALLKKESIKVEYTRKLFSYLRDIRGTVRKLSEGKTLDDLELFEAKYFLYYHRRLAKEWKQLADLEKAWKIVAITGKENYDFYFEDEYSPRLAELREKIKSFVKKKEGETGKFFKKLGIGISDKFVVSKNDKELLNKFKKLKEMKKIKETFSAVLYEFSKTETIIKLEREIKSLVREKSKEKENIRKDIAKRLKPFAPVMLEEFGKIGELDFLISKAMLCASLGTVKPDISESFSVEKGCNPIFKEELAAKKLKYTPLDIELKGGTSVITGSNMAGKTQTLRAMGFLTAMAQAGMFVSAKRFSFTPFNFVFFTTEEPSTEAGFSTFAKEIMRISEILKNKDNSGLILVDEIAKGTNNIEAQALSYAIIEELKKANSFSVITTHLPGLLNISEVSYYRMKGLQVPEKIKENKIESLYDHMDYTIEKGNSEIPMDAIKIAEIMGLDKRVIERAKKFLF